MTLRVSHVTGVLSPFVVEVADAVRSLASDLHYEVLFAGGHANSRGQHWRVDVTGRPDIHLRGDSDHARDWVQATLSQSNPDIVICGGYRGEALEAARSFARRTGARLVFWGEPPFPRPWPITWAKRRVSAHALRDTDLVLCIGDRAHMEYSRLVPIGNAAIVPYGQDLTHHFAIERTVSEDPIRFLFSGRLAKQHNLRRLFSALSSVARQRPGTFSITVAAKGPEQARLDRHIRSNRNLASVLEYDRDYTYWEDRIRPFANSDVLLYPSHHAGWGLVVPEAMAAGMMVVASTGVGSARMLLTAGIDGLIVGTQRRHLLGAINWCIDNPSTVRQMGLEARRSAHRVTAPAVAKTLVDVLRRVRGHERKVETQGK